MKNNDTIQFEDYIPTHYKYAANTWEGMAERTGVYANQEFMYAIAAKNLAEGKKDYYEIVESEYGRYGLKAHEFTSQGIENEYYVEDDQPTVEKLLEAIPKWINKDGISNLDEFQK